MLSNKDRTKSKSQFQLPAPRDFNHHLRRIKNVSHYIDCAPPVVGIETIMKPTLYRRDYEQLIVHTKRNLNLLRNINQINRSIESNYGKVNSCTQTVINSYPYKLRYIQQIEKRNFILADRIMNVKCEVESSKKLKIFWKNVLKHLKRMCRLPIVLPELLESNKLNLNKTSENLRPLVYINLGIKNARPLGRLIIMLYLDLAPRTVKNFIDLCENHRNWPLPQHSYEEIDRNCQLIGTTFTRIFTNLFIYGGNLNHDKKIENFRGIQDYKPESFTYHHGYKGTLSMCPMENGLINSEFTISLKPLRVLDGKRLVFGRVIKGLSILDTVADYGTKNGKPKVNVEITDCGLLNYYK